MVENREIIPKPVCGLCVNEQSEGWVLSCYNTDWCDVHQQKIDEMKQTEWYQEFIGLLNGENGE